MSKQNLKKVKIDEIIKGKGKTEPKKKGRPVGWRKDKSKSTAPITGSDTISLPDDTLSNVDKTTVVPEYDTTVEAGNTLRMPFMTLAGLFQVPEAALTDLEVSSNMPGFRPFYDQYLKPLLGENAVMFSGISVIVTLGFTKFFIIKEVLAHRERMAEIAKQQRESIAPHIPVEVVS